MGWRLGVFVIETRQASIIFWMNGHLPTAHQSEIRKAYIVSVVVDVGVFERVVELGATLGNLSTLAEKEGTHTDVAL